MTPDEFVKHVAAMLTHDDCLVEFADECDGEGTYHPFFDEAGDVLDDLIRKAREIASKQTAG